MIKRFLDPNSIAARLFVVFGIWCVVMFFGAFLGTKFLYRYYQNQLFYAELVHNLDKLRQGHLAQLAAADDDRPTTPISSYLKRNIFFDDIYSGWYWQINGSDGSMLTSRSLWDCQISNLEMDCGPPDGTRGGDPADNEGRLALKKISDGNLETLGEYVIYRLKDTREKAKDDKRELRLGVTGFVEAGGSAPSIRYQYIVAGDYAGLETLAQPFSSTLLLLLAFGALVSFYIGIRFGLSPFNHIQNALTRLRTGGGDPLEDTFPREVMMVITEFDKLIRHSNTAQIENLAHHLRTPLAILANEAQAHPGALADTVKRQAAAIDGSLNHYLERARRLNAEEFITRPFPVHPMLRDIQNRFASMAGQRHVEITLHCPAELVFRGNRGDLMEITEELTSNAVKWARARIDISAQLLGRNLVIGVADDGPGIPVDQRDQVFERGVRLSESVPGSGIGLNNALAIARFAGGAITLKDSPSGGLRAILTLPLQGEA